MKSIWTRSVFMNVKQGQYIPTLINNKTRIVRINLTLTLEIVYVITIWHLNLTKNSHLLFFANNFCFFNNLNTKCKCFKCCLRVLLYTYYSKKTTIKFPKYGCRTLYINVIKVVKSLTKSWMNQRKPVNLCDLWIYRLIFRWPVICR